ncbi:hypothetical protein [Halocatena pleomorpha]|uniref:Uncharacterized protein n=1 Tax=Halocatena pleomorpha TaxID=1785090 RepID=A0A3P3RMX3_9EURY|nr:hypothetical protein [Halocatena pleomorpha]RRJ33743.1 hypothetical protein EIK79_02825 [Halocatena pleomorpha]
MTEQTLGAVDHTNPFTEEAFGTAMVYRRGPVVVTDGGAATEDESATGSRDHPAEEQTGPRLAEIDHTPPHGEGVARDRLYERGRSEDA